ncbi:putative metalloprotease CJM1_0395 family protein [Shewanella woodyi]|uniref:SrpA-related protein n=1 Tax=Shewanella woodyi (strain ATCC 51908 / MS32) TaxID=392500 RepID=B1KHH7_SHEWM|nr:putative metalloprotease CJM1_0395 family protein [Shewanella woodyi]ACA86862.1 SrpA-related protein [Shewanella woodyi ATCC 51908]
MLGVNVSSALSGGSDNLSPTKRLSGISYSTSVSTVTVSPNSTSPSSLSTKPTLKGTLSSNHAPPTVEVNNASLNANTAADLSVQIGAELGAESTLTAELPPVSSSLPPSSFSLTQGALSINGLVSTSTNISSSALQQGGELPASQITGVKEPQLEPDTSFSPVTGADASPVFSGQESASKPSLEPSQERPEHIDEGSKPVFNPFESTQEEDKASEESSAKALVLEQKILAELAKRDAEVRSHEQAHATVGGVHAQSPQLSYEQGSDGRRYAVDGEVSIDISTVPGNPLATINKMRQVYAAAMAPTDPSMADIRVAAEAMRKLNQARAELAEQRVNDAPSIEEMAPLLGAQSSIDQTPIFDPPKFTTAGDVDETGAITKPQLDEVNPVSDSVDKINSQLSAQSMTLETDSHHYLTETVSERYEPRSSVASSLSFSV